MTSVISNPVFQRGLKSVFSGIFPFRVSHLFRNGELGSWFEVADATTVFQDTGGTTPVTASGQSVALILDKSQGLIPKPELVTNGTFDTDTTGWTANGTATLSVVSEALRITHSSNEYAYTSITTEIGKTYTLTLEAIGGTGTSYRVLVGISAGNGALFLGATTPQGVSPSAITFVATRTTHFITLQCFGSGYQDFDNISVREPTGNHATQLTAADRPIYTADAAVENVSSDSLSWSAPAGTYTIAYRGDAGVVILDGQSLSGATDLMLASKIYEYIAVNRPLSLSEETNVRQYLNAKIP